MHHATAYRASTRHRQKSRQLFDASARVPPPVRWHRDIPGPPWNGRQRVKSTQISAYCKVVAREFQPRRIILFGSYAYGRPTSESDVDILVVMPHRSGPMRQSVAIRQRCSAPFPLDLLVWTPAYTAKRLSWNDSFTREVFARGKVMYEARQS
jgi:predicted nucleotidyltransferase